MLKHMIKRLLYSGLPVPGVLRPVIRAGYRGGVWLVEATAFARKLFWVEPVLRSVCAHVGTGLRAERLPYMRGKGTLRLGDRVNLSGRSCFYFMDGVGEDAPEVSVGDGTFVGDACTFSAACRITVGKNCLIASMVRIHDNDGHPLDAARRRCGERISPAECKEVVIGDNVWIGAGAVILKGATLSENAVIGTGAIVTGDVPANTVVAGNPARVLKTLGGEDEQR